MRDGLWVLRDELRDALRSAGPAPTLLDGRAAASTGRGRARRAPVTCPARSACRPSSCARRSRPAPSAARCCRRGRWWPTRTTPSRGWPTCRCWPPDIAWPHASIRKAGPSGPPTARCPPTPSAIPNAARLLDSRRQWSRRRRRRPSSRTHRPPPGPDRLPPGEAWSPQRCAGAAALWRLVARAEGRRDEDPVPRRDRGRRATAAAALAAAAAVTPSASSSPTTACGLLDERLQSALGGGGARWSRGIVAPLLPGLVLPGGLGSQTVNSVDGRGATGRELEVVA